MAIALTVKLLMVPKNAAPGKGAHSAPFQRATLKAMPDGVFIVKVPPAKTSLPRTAMALTTPGTPAPSADHSAPFHRAMLRAAAPPALVKLPPAYTKPPPA